MSGVDEFLGDFADDLDDEQKDDLARAFTILDVRYPLDDDGQDDWIEERQSAAGAAAQVLLGGETVESLAGAWRAAAAREREAMAELTGAIVLASLHESENSLSERLNLNRMTVRKMLGKR